MKITAIMSTYHGYYYQRNVSTLTTRTSKTVKAKTQFIETAQTSYQTPLSNSSAEYVKTAYQVYFKPHELISNLQEVPL